jgi:hypothetical protein
MSGKNYQKIGNFCFYLPFWLEKTTAPLSSAKSDQSKLLA